MRWPSDTILFSCDNKSYNIFFITSRDNVYHWCHIPVSTLCGNDPLLMNPCFWQQCRLIKTALAFYWSSRLLLTSSDWLSHENEWIATMHFCVYSQASLRGMNQMHTSWHAFLFQNLRKMEGETPEGPGRDLNELQNADWVRLETILNVIVCCCEVTLVLSWDRS